MNEFEDWLLKRGFTKCKGSWYRRPNVFLTITATKVVLEERFGSKTTVHSWSNPMSAVSRLMEMFR